VGVGLAEVRFSELLCGNRSLQPTEGKDTANDCQIGLTSKGWAQNRMVMCTDQQSDWLALISSSAAGRPAQGWVAGPRSGTAWQR
jgi:hypothetical protein